MNEEKIRIKELETEVQFVSDDDFVAVDGASGTRKIKAKKLADSVFVADYGTTTFANIKAAIGNGLCVKCDVAGYTYELVQSTSLKITFSLTNNTNGSITQESVWVTSDDTWDAETTNLAKLTSVPTKTSDLTNDSNFVADAPIDGKQYARKNGNWSEVEGGASSYKEVDIYNYFPCSSTSTDRIDVENGVLKYASNGNTPSKDLSSLITQDTKKIEINIRFKLNHLRMNRNICLFGNQTSGLYFRFASAEIQKNSSNEIFGIWGAVTTDGTSWNNSFFIQQTRHNINPLSYNDLKLKLDIENSLFVIYLNNLLIYSITLNNSEDLYKNVGQLWGFGSVAQNNQTAINNDLYIDLTKSYVMADGVKIFQFTEKED